MSKLHAVTLSLIVSIAASLGAANIHAGIGTSVPISAQLATNMATSLFPVGATLQQGNLFLSEPVIVFLDEQRIAIRARFQAYDHRPEQGIAVSEMGYTQVSGELQYDSKTKEILLHNPDIDELQFDRNNLATQRFREQLEAQWIIKTSSPLRSKIPPHPYLSPFKEHIQNISYNGKNINLDLYYQ